jgi:hypothetical protein
MNLGQLEHSLSESLAWRKQELQQARFLAEDAEEASRQYLCRAWTLVMYAHCDQYIKEVSRIYLSYLKDNPRSSYDYWCIWQAFRAKELMLNGSDGPNYDSVLKPRDNQRSMLIEAISHKTVLDSGNFKYERLRFVADFVLQIDFDCASYKGFCTTLKIKRDEIAHGEQSYVNEVSDCVDWHGPTLSLLDGLTHSVLQAGAEI